MIRYASVLLIGSLILGSCLTRREEDQLSTEDSLALLHDTITAGSAETDDFGSEDMQDECIFDTSTYKFTTDKLKQYQPNISYHWDRRQAEARTVLADGDTLWLHIGGCDHFSYMATLSTALSLADSAALMDKTRWLARTFLDNGFDNVYDEMISQGSFARHGRFIPGELNMYNVIVSDTAVTDHVYDGFSFSMRGPRTQIEISGYIN